MSCLKAHTVRDWEVRIKLFKEQSCFCL